MAKISNTDAINEAIAICDRLANVENLNRCSAAWINFINDSARTNQYDGKYLLIKAKGAEYAHYLFTEVLTERV